MNSFDAKSKMVEQILSAYDEAREANVKDPEQKILQTIEAKKELKSFLKTFILPQQ